jgi:hypothetical protein
MTSTGPVWRADLTGTSNGALRMSYSAYVSYDYHQPFLLPVRPQGWAGIFGVTPPPPRYAGLLGLGVNSVAA